MSSDETVTLREFFEQELGHIRSDIGEIKTGVTSLDSRMSAVEGSLKQRIWRNTFLTNTGRLIVAALAAIGAALGIVDH